MARGNQRLVSVAQAADSLGVSLSTVWRRIGTGTLPSVRSGGRRLVPERALKSAAMGEIEQIPPFTMDHPMWRLMGAYRSGGEGPGARDKHAILDS
ncbi:MAG: helix-turn-helix domain-containing protein [Myxococcota bacterium]